jgi:hypothetical protein
VIELVNPHQPVRRHIRDEDPRHSQRHLQHRRNLRYRAPATAQAQDGLALGAQQGQIPVLIMGDSDHRLDLKLVPRLRPAPGHGVRPDQEIFGIA